MKELIGTGAFVLESFAAEDRAILKKNPDYWGTDDRAIDCPTWTRSTSSTPRTGRPSPGASG